MVFSQERFAPQLEALAVTTDRIEMLVQRVAGVAAEKCQVTAKRLLDGVESDTGRAVICFFREARANAQTQNFRGIMTAMIPMVTELGFEVLEKQVVDKVIVDVLAWIQTATATVMQSVIALCSFIPAAGAPLCAAVTSTLSSAVNAIVPKLAMFAVNGVWKLFKRQSMLKINNMLTFFLESTLDSSYVQAAGQGVASLQSFTSNVTGAAQFLMKEASAIFNQYLQFIAPEAHMGLVRCDQYLEQIATIAREAMGAGACRPPPPPPPPAPPRLRFNSLFNQAWDRNAPLPHDPNHHEVFYSEPHSPIVWDDATQSFNATSSRGGGSNQTAWYELPQDWQPAAEDIVQNPPP